MKDGDFVLTESVAMLRYLSREKQVPVSCLVASGLVDMWTSRHVDMWTSGHVDYCSCAGGGPLVPQGQPGPGQGGRVPGVAAPGHQVTCQE